MKTRIIKKNIFSEKNELEVLQHDNYNNFHSLLQLIDILPFFLLEISRRKRFCY